MNKLITISFICVIAMISSCDSTSDETIIGLPFELRNSYKVNEGENSDSLFNQTLILDPKLDSSVVINFEEYNSIYINELFFKISRVTTDAETSFGYAYIAYGVSENEVIDTLIVMDSLNITDIMDQDYQITLTAEETANINSSLSKKEPIYFFIEGNTSAVPVVFTLTIWAEMVLRTGV